MRVYLISLLQGVGTGTGYLYPRGQALSAQYLQDLEEGEQLCAYTLMPFQS